MVDKKKVKLLSFKKKRVFNVIKKIFYFKKNNSICKIYDMMLKDFFKNLL